MKKKLLSALLVAAMCMTALAGCGSSSDDKDADTAKEDGGEEEVSAGSDTVVGADDASTVLKWGDLGCEDSYILGGSRTGLCGQESGCKDRDDRSRIR